MSSNYKYGDMARVDKLMEECTKQGYRPAKVSKLCKDMKKVSENVDKALAALNSIRERLKPLCTHAVEDLVYSQFGMEDTLGKYSYTVSYLTCKLCGEEIWRDNS